MILVDVGAAAPLELMLFDGRTDRFVRAKVRNSTGAVIQTINLPSVGDGFYLSTFSPPAAGFYFATFTVYAESTYTTEDLTYTRRVQVYRSQAPLTPATIAGAVWDEPTAPHQIPNTFGDYVHVIRQTGFANLEELTHAVYGLEAIHDEVGARANAIVSEINANESKIDAIVPAISAAKAQVIAEVDQNEIALGNLAAQLTATTSTLTTEINQNEAKLDALTGQVGALQNNTTVRFIVPERLIKPTTGTKSYQFHLRLFDETGNPEAPDTSPTLRIRNLATGIDELSGVAMTQDGAKVGAYFYTYTLGTGAAVAPRLVEVTILEGGVARYVPATTEVTEFETDLTALSSQVSAVQTTVTDINTQVTSGSHGLAVLKAGQTTLLGEVNDNQTRVDALQASVDALPTDVATSGQATAILSAVGSKPSLAQIQSALDATEQTIRGVDGRNVTEVYDLIDTALPDLAKTADPRFAHLDAPVSSRSTLTAAQVWNYASRTLSVLNSLNTNDIKAIWDYQTAAATYPGSMGQRVADYLDAAVSSRAQAIQVLNAISDLSKENTLLGVHASLTNEANENQILINSVISAVTNVLTKTSNLPSDPASQSALISAIAAVSTAVGNVDLRTQMIRAKTDLIPPDPAKESSVSQRPTNPLLTTDARLNKLANLDVPVSSVSSSFDHSQLATKADVDEAQIDIAERVSDNLAILQAVRTLSEAIKVKADRIPTFPATTQDVVGARDEVIERIDELEQDPELTAAQVWAHPDRTLTQDPGSFGPDVSQLATKADLEPLARRNYTNRMSSVFNAATSKQEVIVWAERDGQRVVGSDCVVQIKNQNGDVIWTSSTLFANSDGVFKFSSPFAVTVSQNYYIVIKIVVDGAERVSHQAFFTVVW